MALTVRSISFFDDSITIRPHTASLARHLAKPVSVRGFADGGPVSLSLIEETGDYLVTRPDGTFMEGPEVAHG